MACASLVGWTVLECCTVFLWPQGWSFSTSSVSSGLFRDHRHLVAFRTVLTL